SDFFGEAPERRPWITEHDDAGRSLPGFIFAFVFYWLELPTDCAIEPTFYAQIGPQHQRDSGEQRSHLARSDEAIGDQATKVKNGAGEIRGSTSDQAGFCA